MQKFTEDDYKVAPTTCGRPANVVQQFRMRITAGSHGASPFISTLTTMAEGDAGGGTSRGQAAGGPLPLSGRQQQAGGSGSAQPNEIGHMHFQDVPDMPGEHARQHHAPHPGDGISPADDDSPARSATRDTRDRSRSNSSCRVQQADPFMLAQEIRQKAEGVNAQGPRAVMARASVRALRGLPRLPVAARRAGSHPHPRQ